jgi:acetoacetyl-CoA reductase
MPRVAIVTGGARGIGEAICGELEKQGCRVASLDSVGGGASVMATLPITCDVSDFDACAAAVKQVEAALGPVDILVNNAGIVRDAMLHKMTLEQWRAVISVDMDSLFNMTRQVVGGMRDRGFGRIINISSINAQKGQLGQTNYCAAKAGMLGFTRALALECASKGVTVNAVAPGYIDTAMLASVPAPIMDQIVKSIPVGRIGHAEEIARCVSFLAADEAGLITGAVLSANGGMYMS